MTKKEQVFIDTVWNYYRQHGRHTLPWRTTRDPYRILVSEIMLQQTQVDRVIPKFHSFLDKFPTQKELACASLSQVLRSWQGLGYNRRAKLLHRCVQEVEEVYEGKVPQSYETLIRLPGIGPYTAGAVMAFAFKKPVPIIETNIRSAYLHYFFKHKTNVRDEKIVPYVVRTMDVKNVREWYWALMDYGSYVKRTHGNPNKKSAHYTKQSRFEGSDRQIRGAVLRLLSESDCLTRKEIQNTLNIYEEGRVLKQTVKLLEEKMIICKKQRYSLPT